MIQIKTVHKSYGTNEVLKDINLTIGAGKIHGLVGENGAGKTTLFKCICGLENYEGNIEYEGKVLKNISGFLPTNPFFLSRMTGEEYLYLMANARNIELKNPALFNVFDLPLEKYAATYSTGMKKKLAISALLLQKNEIFILDEPFNGVDIHSNLVIIEILEKLKSSNKIVILSSHIFSSLKEICDEIHYLKDHQIRTMQNKNAFDEIEQEMKNKAYKNRIDQLDL